MCTHARVLGGFAVALSFLAGSAAATPGAGAEELVGTPARSWHADHWLNSDPLELEQLRGRVILVRWWTAPECPFCAATAPALNDFHARYAKRGLSVVGFYHHKSSSALNPGDVERYAKLFKFQFPIAIDPEWTTLRSWWLDHPRKFTSVSFLIDRRGIVRHLHPGGQYVKGEPAHAKLEAMIERLLAE